MVIIVSYIPNIKDIFFPVQLEGKDLVEMFCEMQMELYEKAVGESLTQLAFEAVEEIVNVSTRRSQ